MARPSKADPQQYKVYALENDLQGPTVRMSRKDMRGLCGRVCEAYAVTAVRLQFRDLKGWSGACYPDGRIVIGIKRTSATVQTVLHELAHHVHNQLSGELWTEQQAHGPEFMACYIHILDRARVIPFVAMKALCRDRGVKFRDPGKTGSLKSLKRVLR